MEVAVQIEYLINTKSSEDRLFKLLSKLDDAYIPSLSSQVSLEDYCFKLILNADVFIARVDGQDIGVLAVYLNDFAENRAFISLIGILPAFQGIKLGQILIDKAKEESIKRGFKLIRLEVNKANIKAVHFYEKNNFICKEGLNKEHSYIMDLML